MMAAATSTATTQQSPPRPPAPVPEDTPGKAAHKRYEGLMMVRMKALKGKGAWYWVHLEPILVRGSDSGLPEFVKLRCSLCDAVFSASNPSRTASEHLKRGTCPNFSDPNPNPDAKPISSLPPAGMPLQNHRKRSSGNRRGRHTVAPLALIEPARFSIDGSPYSSRPDQVPPLSPAPTPATVSSGRFYSHHHHQEPVVLSGGKEDLGALAMFEDSVKKLKTPKPSPGQTLTKPQIDSSLQLLSNWMYENCGSVSFSSLEHPKFKNFLNQVGLPGLTRQELAGERLETKYSEAKSESEARIRDAMFFQISSDGWRSNNYYNSNESEGEKLVNLSLNLPNGTSVFRRAVLTTGYVFSNYAEDVLSETINEICGKNNLQQCVGIVSDKFRFKALKNLENQHQWMINLSCQFQGVHRLIKDFSKELPLFHNVTQNCLKVANFVNTRTQVRNHFLKYQLQEYCRAGLLRVPICGSFDGFEFEPVFNLVEDVLNSARALQLLFVDEGYKIASVEEKLGREIEEMLRDSQFWQELNAVYSLVKLIKSMAREIEKERPRIGQCLPLWEELRVKIRDWCAKYHVDENHAHQVFDKRFKRNYHPAWAAAFVLDPFYLVRDRSGKYLPPFKCLTSEQEKDVDRLITRLVSRNEAHVALMELMKWRTEGLDPVYAQAVQLKQRDPITGKMKIANPQSSRLVWETYLTDFESLRKVAMRLIFLHATSCGFKWNSCLSRWAQSRNGMEKAQKMIFIAAHSKLKRRDFSNEEEKDLDFFAVANGDGGEEDVMNEVFDASSL